MIAYRGHLSLMRQYIPARPIRYGIKVWALVSNQSRYIYNLIPYLGKYGHIEVGYGERVVSQLVRGSRTVVTFVLSITSSRRPPSLTAYYLVGSMQQAT